MLEKLMSLTFSDVMAFVSAACFTSKCENDPCYVVRMVCAEEIEANNLVSDNREKTHN